MSSLHHRMRQVLLSQPDGLPLSVLASKIGANSYEQVLRAFSTMSDAYIDRWVPRRGSYEPVVMLADIPVDCPHPSGIEPLGARQSILRSVQ